MLTLHGYFAQSQSMSFNHMDSSILLFKESFFELFVKILVLLHPPTAPRNCSDAYVRSIFLNFCIYFLFNPFFKNLFWNNYRFIEGAKIVERDMPCFFQWLHLT